MAQSEYTTGPAESRYNALEHDREPFLDRAVECSKLTLPYLIPPKGHTSGTILPTPYQSIGSSGVSGLSAKLLQTELPSNEPCFRLRVDNMIFEKQQSEVDPEWRMKIEKALMRCEQTVLGDIESTGDRVVVDEMNKHLLIGGNVLLHDDMDDGLRMFPLSRFVVVRDPMGKWVEAVVRESIHYDSLDEDAQAAILASGASPGSDAGTTSRPATVELFTHIKREKRKWTVYQECRGVEIPKSRGGYPLDACPWYPVRMYHVPGEDYGRSYIEQFLGDLHSLEVLTQAIVEGSAAAAKILIFVNPNGMTSAKAVTEAQNGDVLEGNADDVTVLSMNKQADLQIAERMVDRLEGRLKVIFLMTDGMRRNAERVTAEEIRAIVKELESTLGGVYTIISQEFQLPYIKFKLHKLTKQKRMPALPKGIVKPTVVTGFDALGRGQDKDKLLEFLKILKDLLDPQAYAQLIKSRSIILRLASSCGLSVDDMLNDEQSVNQSNQQTSAQGMVDKLGPEVIRQAGPALMAQMGGQMGGQMASPTPQQQSQLQG